MNAQEQNWQNLFGNYTREGIAWHGIWTVYSPEKEIVKSFQGVRSFRIVDEEQTAIIHTNNYTYSDGSTAEKTWQIDKQSCDRPDGVTHPAILSMRALSFGQGATAWVSKTLEPGKKSGAELFFRYKDWRTSVATIYDESGDLEKITLIREHLGSSPNTAGPEIENLLGKWLGTKEEMNPDLKVSPAEETQALVLDPTEGKNETFFLPDRVVVNSPKRIKVGEQFEIVTGKQVSNDEYKRLTAKYDQSGAFTLLISEVFRRKE